MIAILSPAMNMAFSPSGPEELTRPAFAKDADYLAGLLRRYEPWELESLLGVNPELALRSWEHYRDFGRAGGASPALASFRGLAYQQLNPGDFTKDDWIFAVEHLRMLSGLYGLLRPSDGIHPYRLDFVCPFAKQKIHGRRLYDYWGDRICRALYKETDTLLNLCSGEYEKLVIPHLKRGNRLVTCRFLVSKRGALRCQATASKMARGQMARFLVRERIKGPEALRAFAWDDYTYAPDLSGEGMMIFVKP